MTVMTNSTTFLRDYRLPIMHHASCIIHHGLASRQIAVSCVTCKLRWNGAGTVQAALQPASVHHSGLDEVLPPFQDMAVDSSSMLPVQPDTTQITYWSPLLSTHLGRLSSAL